MTLATNKWLYRMRLLTIEDSHVAVAWINAILRSKP